MTVKSLTKSMIALCLTLGSVQWNVSVAAESAKPAEIKPVDAQALPGVSDSPSVAELAAQTKVPGTLTLAADNPSLAKQAPATINLSSYNASAEGATVTPVSQPIAPPRPLDDPTATPTTHAPTPAAKPVVSCEKCEQCDNSCDCFACCKCGPQGQFWIRDEYVGWWMQGGQVPALVNTSSTGTLPTDTTLYGNATYNGGFRSGNWTQGGMWFDCCHTCGIQADYFFAGQKSAPFFASSDGSPILTRPFIDATTGLPSEELVAVPGIVVGNISIDNHNSLDGAGVSLRRNLCCCERDCGCNSCWCEDDCCRVDFVYGFRYYGFRDVLGIRENLTSIDPLSPIAIGTQFDIRDSFTTQNNFYGGEIGLIGQRYFHRWMLEGTAKVALGDMDSITWINGSTNVSFPGQPTAFNEGGLLALSSNIGRHEHNEFVAIPQFSLRLGYRVTERLTFLTGYTLMYFSQIGRAGDQIDNTVNPNLIPPPVQVGPNRPAFNFHPSDLVLQGITLGLEYDF